MTLLLAVALVQAWVPGQIMPNPRFAAAAAVVGERVYLLGGASGNVSRPMVRDVVDAYDVAADSWITGLAPMPVPRFFAASALFGGRVFVMGGTDGRAEYRRVDRYDPVSDAWDTVAALPLALQAPAAANFAGDVYVCGGYAVFPDSVYSRRVFRFVPDSGPGAWHEVDSLTVPRADAAAAVTAGRLYVTGGKYFNGLSSAEYYEAGSWLPVPEPMTEARSGHAAVGYATYLVVFGGEGTRGALNSVDVLNVTTGEWLSVEPMSFQRVYLTAALAADRLVVLAGWAQHGGMAAVETHDLFYPPGVEEQPGIALPVSVPGRVMRGPVDIPAGEAYVLYDAAGAATARGRGPVSLDPAPGVYFVMTSGAMTRLTIVR